jgi:hypothetical protein
VKKQSSHHTRPDVSPPATTQSKKFSAKKRDEFQDNVMRGMTGTMKKPIHRMAWIGFATSLIAAFLAWYGSLRAEKQLPNSPLHDARNVSAKPPEPSHWYERVWARAEVSIFGGGADQKILALTERSKIARYSLQLIAFGLPLILGLCATYIGATAMKAIEKSQGRFVGNFQAVFAIMTGGFASVIAGCMIFSIFAWRFVPSIYTH